MNWLQGKSKRKTGEQTLAGPGLALEGDFAATSYGTFAARLHGTLTSDHFMRLAPEAEVIGPVQLGSGSIAGTVQGDVSVKNHLGMEAAAFVEGKISADSLDIEAGARFTGKLAIGKEPS